MRIFNLFSGNGENDDNGDGGMDDASLRRAMLEMMMDALMGGRRGRQVGIYFTVVDAENRTVGQYHSPASSSSPDDTVIWTEPCSSCGDANCNRVNLARFLSAAAEHVGEARVVETLEEAGGMVLAPVVNNVAKPPSAFGGFIDDLSM